ncbi:MAG: cyclic nucleotide-binding domain-containing protein [Gammaproteobacteria bacterium]|jgi:CRP-like cAMP-binding protein|nr:cyclic nucleotide-binding domain-containing protein [Gammaproteobacteria bacterium]
MIPTVERILFLQKIPLFESFSVDELWQVAQALDEMTYAKGEMLFEEGKPAHAMYLIVSGTVEASVVGKTIATLGKESILGDVAILDGMPYVVSVTASDEVVAIKIEREKLDDILDANPGAARGVIRVLTRKLRYFGQQVIDARQGKKMDSDPMDLTELKL